MLLWAVLTACHAPVPVAPPTVVSVEASVRVPSVLVVRLSAGAGSSLRVEHPGGESWSLQGDPVDPSLFYLVGLKAGEGYVITPLLDSDEGALRGDAREITAPAAPLELTRATLTEAQPEAAMSQGGTLLIAIGGATGAWIAGIDGEGDWVWWAPADPGLTAAAPQLSLDGESLIFAQHDAERLADRAIATRLSLNGAERTDTRTLTGHHMVQELSDGRMIWLGRRAQQGTIAGFTGEALADTVLVAPEGAVEGEETVLFDFLGDYGELYAPCSHVTTPTDLFGWEGVHEWTHANSLMVDEGAGLVYVMIRHLDALLALDLETGEQVWQLGGRYGNISSASPPFEHAHTSEVDAQGMWVFDNGNHRGVSRVVRWEFDEGTAEAVRVIPAPEDRLVDFLGDVRSLPDEHVLTAWAKFGDIVEFDEADQQVWRLDMGPGVMPGRIRYLPAGVLHP